MLQAEKNECIDLPQSGSWPATKHIFDEKSVWAVRAALAAERPLLIRGEPGTGKSQLARAAAVKMNRAFISEVVHSRSEPQDLQWQFDAVARLGEAQILGSSDIGSSKEELDPKKFLSPSALWWAFDYVNAEKHRKDFEISCQKPFKPDNWKPKNGCVVLIDEIDKADADLPNGLLETLGNGAFTIPYLDSPIGVAEGTPPPLVVITTNEERELPRAFLRRCMVLHMELPKEDKELTSWLVERGGIHFSKLSESVKKDAADLLIKDRKAAIRLGHSPPGQAEYLDILRALVQLGRNEKEQKEALENIKTFALSKHSDEVLD